jgi:hypothetical protein
MPLASASRPGRPASFARCSFRWLCPGAEIAARFYEKKGQPPAGFETIDEFYARSEIIPHVPVNDPDHAPAIKALFTKRAARGRH